jgi:predicted O-methyltransferase YrrM
MRYVDLSVGSCFIPKLLGTYERELAPKIELICEKQPGLVVDLGAAEGYYAIGLALRIPQARVVAFELDETGQTALWAMAELNGIGGRLSVRGRCEPQDLSAALAGESSPVVVCDVEGDEEKL